MEVYIDVPLSEDIVDHLESLMKKHNLETHNDAVNYLIGLSFIHKATSSKQEASKNVQ